MKKIVLAFSCVFLMNGFALADDNRYKVVEGGGDFVIIDTKKERIKWCYRIVGENQKSCGKWESW